MNNIILGYLGEVALKGLNKKVFENTLIKNIKTRLENIGDFKISNAQSTIYVEPLSDDCDMDRAYDIVQKTFGLANVSFATICKKNFEDICKIALETQKDNLMNVRTFKVICRRADKTFPMSSMELSAELGGFILSNLPHLAVDVRNPQAIVFVEIRDFAAYIHSGKKVAVGGMPVSTSGKATLMLSGGIDSPVSAYMMAKRGLNLMAIHFASPPYTSQRAEQKVIDLAQILTVYTGKLPLLIVPFTKVQEAIRDNSKDVLFTVLMRRSMMRIASALSKRYGSEAIITGESLAQVASQTLKAIACTNEAQDLPVLRPLIGMDKTEIVDISRKIGTYETSIQPYEDCCTIFTPPHPKTKPSISEILEAESMMDLVALENTAVEEVKRIFLDIKEDM